MRTRWIGMGLFVGAHTRSKDCQQGSGTRQTCKEKESTSARHEECENESVSQQPTTQPPKVPERRRASETDRLPSRECNSISAPDCKAQGRE